MNISKEAARRFKILRASLFDEIKKILDEPGAVSKSYEGAMSVSVQFPGLVDERAGKLPRYAIHLDCYVVGPARHYDWTGTTFEAALEDAEADIMAWIENAVDDRLDRAPAAPSLLDVFLDPVVLALGKLAAAGKTSEQELANGLVHLHGRMAKLRKPLDLRLAIRIMADQFDAPAEAAA